MSADATRLFDDCHGCGWRVYSDPPAGWDHFPGSDTTCVNATPSSLDKAWRHLTLTPAVTLRLDRVVVWLTRLLTRRKP